MATAGWETVLRIARETVAWGTEVVTDMMVLGLTNDVHFGPFAADAISAGHARDGTNILQEAQTCVGRKVVAVTGCQTALSPRAMQWLIASLASDPSTEALPATDVVQELDYSGGGTVSDVPSVYYTIMKWMGQAARSIEVAGSVINRVAVDCPADGVGQITFDFLGEDDSAPASSTLKVSGAVITDTALRTNDCTVYWGTTEIDPISFGFELNNNAFHVFTEGQIPDAILLGPMAFSASVVGEWLDTGITDGLAADSRAGTIRKLTFQWGSPGSNGYLFVDVDAKIIPTPAQTEGDNFQQVTFNFEGVKLTTGGSTWQVTTNSPVAFLFNA